MQFCLNSMTSFLQIVKVHGDQFDNFTEETTTVFQGKLDKWVKQLEEIREEHMIDQKLANERDQMDVSDEED